MVFQEQCNKNMETETKSNIIEFYEKHSVDKDFDEIFYDYFYPETKDFYQPYCEENNISEKQRLFFHFFNYGRNMGFMSHWVDSINKDTNPDDKTVTNVYNPFICCNSESKKRNINLIKDRL